MKIMYDHQIFAAQEYGGISRYFVRLAEFLPARENIDTRVIAPLHINAYLPQLAAEFRWGRRVPRRRGMGRAIAAVNQAVSPVLERLHGPDIVHQTYFTDRPHAGSAPVVLTVYDMIHEKFAYQFPAADRTAARKRIAVERADHIICISASTRRDLLELYPAAADKASVTLLGFDPVVARDGDGPAVGGRPYLLFVGQRRGYKNFSGLLDAYAGSRQLRDSFGLVAVGGGGFTGPERKAIAAHGIDDRVEQVDASDALLQGWYRGAAAFVYPSLYEGFGIPPLEAMAAGCPVIAVGVSSVPEVCGDAARYAADGSADALRDAIEAVTGSPMIAAGLRAAGTRRLEQFSWQRCAAETAAIYRAMV